MDVIKSILALNDSKSSTQIALDISQAHIDTEEEEKEKEDDDDQHTYEVPPNESHNKRLAPAKQQEAAEDVYLDQPVLRRFSEPNNFLQPKPHLHLSKHGAEGSNEEAITRLWATEKALKTGKTKPPPPPPLPLSARRVSLPVLSSSGQQMKTSTNRDPFPALKDDEEESIYLICEPSTDSIPCRLPPCPISTPLKQLRAKIFQSGPRPGLTENSPQGEGLKSGSLPEDSSVQNKVWYAGSCDRRTAEAALLRFNKDSAYLVRRSSGHGWNQPYTLVVLYKNRVYNIPIRYLENSHQYTLGKDGKNQEEIFDNISSIIQSYMERPLVLIDGTTSAKEQTCLLFPVKP
ncbi:SH2 domain-containing protein 6-like [Heteronotia binoei]|uniref:SH2 domain-containing protein 6-like n=1 Tax=Heteronotia binoei TaxID=13085 RepID=UPI00292F194E|nr:SH2 domain-containing protein 6-like [Heteronotia binoei]